MARQVSACLCVYVYTQLTLHSAEMYGSFRHAAGGCAAVGNGRALQRSAAAVGGGGGGGVGVERTHMQCVCVCVLGELRITLPRLVRWTVNASQFLFKSAAATAVTPVAQTVLGINVLGIILFLFPEALFLSTTFLPPFPCIDWTYSYCTSLDLHMYIIDFQMMHIIHMCPGLFHWTKVQVWRPSVLSPRAPSPFRFADWHRKKIKQNSITLTEKKISSKYFLDRLLLSFSSNMKIFIPT